MTVATTSRRPRRVASDEAHAWARNLRLGNPFAKSVLQALAGYVNGEGMCFVSIEQLADDTDLSMDTVRKRMAWLETIGAIARFPQWIDASGRRNSETRGKRTTDEIRLILSADPDEIERRAAGDVSESTEPDKSAGDGGDASVSPRSQQGLTDDVGPRPQQGLNPVSARSALGQPSDSGKGLDSSNHEPELNPPNPPSGGGQAIDQDLEDTLSKFSETYPAPITNLPRLRTLLQAMTQDERCKLLTAVKGYASFIGECERKGKPRAVKDADRWVANGLWQGYVGNGEKVEEIAQRVTVEADSDEARAWVNLCLVGRAPRPMLIAGGYSLRRALTPQELTFIDLPPEREWAFLLPDQDAQKIGAWREFLGNALRGINRADLLRERGVGGSIQRGVLVPWPWPPRKDGSLCTGPPAE